MGQTLAYVRVSTDDQCPDRQIAAVGEVDRTFEDHLSGADAARPELRRLVDYAREGDEVRVASMDRLARSLADLLGLVTEITGKGATLRFLKEGLSFTDGSGDAFAELQLHLLGAVAQFERRLIRDRQAEGIEAAKQRGAYLGRRPALTPEQVDEVRQRLDGGETKASICRAYGVGRSSLYRALNGQGAAYAAGPGS